MIIQACLMALLGCGQVREQGYPCAAKTPLSQLTLSQPLPSLKGPSVTTGGKMTETPCSPGSQQVSIPVTGAPLWAPVQMGSGMQGPLGVLLSDVFLSRDSFLIKAGLGEGRDLAGGVQAFHKLSIRSFLYSCSSCLWVPPSPTFPTAWKGHVSSIPDNALQGGGGHRLAPNLNPSKTGIWMSVPL